MSVTYAITNNYGPGLPSVTGGTSGIPWASGEPSAPATPEGTPANTDVTNTGRTEMACQYYMVTDQNYPGTPPPKTSHGSGNDIW